MFSALLAKWMTEVSSRPLLGRWCHLAYNTSCDLIRKAEFNTNDHGLVLVHATGPPYGSVRLGDAERAKKGDAPLSRGDPRAAGYSHR
jgi:hypothetical protein